MTSPTTTYTFSNGTTIVASQHNQNFTDIINALTDATKSLSIDSLTLAGAFTANGNCTLGNASGDDITITGSLAASIPIKTNNSFDIGAATLGLAGIYLGAPSSRSTRLTSNQSIASSFTLVLPVSVGSSGQWVTTDGSGNLSFSSSFSIPVLAPAGTVSAPGIAFSTDTNTGLYSAAADVPAIACGGTYVMSFTTAGCDIGGTSGRLDVMDRNANDGTGAARFRNLHTTADDNTRVMQLYLGGGADMTNAKYVVFTDSNSTCGSISAASATTVAFNTSSDLRLKENIKYDWGALDIISKIKPAEFNFIGDGKKRVVHGFIAQELYEVLPEVVSVGSDMLQVRRKNKKGKDDFHLFDPAKNPGDATSELNQNAPHLTNPWSVDYGKLTGVLAKAVKELLERVQQLEAKLAI